MSEYDDAVRHLDTPLTPKQGPDGGLAIPGMTPPPGQPTGQDQGYGQVFDLLDEAAKRAAKGAVAGNLDANPDKAGRAMTLAPKVGVPAPSVEQSLQAYEDQHHLQQSAAIIDQNPSLADWLSADQQRARVAKDDFDKLDFVSKATKALASGWEAAVLGNERGRLGAAAMAGGAEQVKQPLAIVTKRLAANPEIEGLYGKLQKVAGFAGGMLDNFLHGATAGAAGGAAVGAAGGAAAGGVGAVPGAFGGALLGGLVVGPAVDMGKVAAGNAFLDMSEMRGDDGSEISLPVKEAAAVLIGLGTTALGTVGIKGAGASAQEAASKLLSDAMVQATTKPTVQRALGQFAAKMGKAGLQGAALNAAMSGVDIFGKEFAKAASGADFQTVFNDPVERQKAVDQLITAATDGAMLFPLVHLPFHAGSLVGDTLRARSASADVAAFQQLETGAVESKTRGRSLDAFHDFMARQTDGTPIETLGLESDAVRTLYQSAGVEPGPGDGLLGDVVPDLREQMRQAAETGGDITVPTASYVSRLAGTPLSESLRESIRFRPDGMTMREAAEYEAQRGDLLKSMAEEAGLAANDAYQAAEPTRQVFEDVLGKLREAGQTVDASRAYASLVASRYEARAAALEGKMGSALDLYRKEGLEIRRELSETLRRVDYQDLIINALRNPDRKEATPKELFGPSLHEAVRAAGGVVDTGGELKGMDLHKVRGLVRKATGDRKADIEHSVDAMALRMWEAGYFPELTERPTPDEFFDAMRRGDKRYSEGVNNERKAAFEEAVRDLDEFISRSDLDLKTATNEQIKEALAKASEEQAAGRTLEQTQRGRITLDAGKAIITLMRDADLSTFLHESGHLWLDEMARDALMPDAPEALKADAATIAKWLKADDFANLTTEQHEQFARGFEAYLLEGRAPSSALASAFRKFKSWLTRIYKSVAGLNVPMSDEIRGVFDRMVASEDQIASWRQAEGLNPVFATAKDAGMTDAEFQAYTKGVERARTKADQKMLDRTMEAVRRQRTAEWKAEAATVREEVDAQQRSRADLKAQYFLRTGKMLDDPEAPAAERVRISKAALEDMYGTEEASKALPAGVVGREGVHPDELADLFGYRSGDDLVRALMTLEASRKQAEEATGRNLSGDKYLRYLTEQETQRIMLERHGDALNDGSIEAEALDAVHNAAQADVMAMEMRAIAKQAGTTPLRLDDTKAWADDQLAGMPIERATNQAAFARAEAKAGRDVQRALLAGKTEAAFKAKQQQLINHVMATKAGEAREAYDAGVASWKKLAKAQKRESVQQSFLDQVHGILERLGMNVRRDDLEVTLGAENLRQFTERLASEGQDVFVPEFLLDGFRVDDVRDLTASQFFEINDAIKSILHLGRQMREMEINGEKVRFENIVSDMREVIGDRTRGDIGVTHAVTKAEKAWLAVLTAKAGLRRMDGWARTMDRGDLTGPFTTYIVRPIYAALDKYRPAKAEYLGKLWDIIGPRRKELNQGKLDAPEIGYTFANKGELLHAIAHTGNDSNMRKLLIGRRWGEMDKDGNLDASRWDGMVRRMADQGTLTAKDFDTVQAIWDLLEELKPGAQEAHRSIYGVRFGEITARPVQTPFGEYRGGYMPAVVDRLMSREGQVREDKAALDQQQTGTMFPSTGRGFTKSRVENYAEPLELNLAVIPSHIDSVLRFTHLQPAIRDVGRLMLKRSFKDMMRGVDPTIVSGMIVPWLQRTARQTQQIPATDPVGRMGDRALNALRRRAGLQILAFNVVNTMQQFVGIAPGVLRSSPGAMLRSLYAYVKEPVTTANRIAEASPFMDERMRGKSYEVMTALRDAIEDTTKFDDVAHWGHRNAYTLQQMTQSVVDITTWQAAYEHATAAGKDHADAVYAADEAVRETQGGMNPEDLSRFETGTALGRLFSQMYSYFGSQANMLGTEASLIKNLGFKAGSKRAAMVYVFGLMIPSLVGEAIFRTASGGWGDDEDAGEAGALADFFLGAQVRYMAPMVPIAGPVAMAVAEGQQDRIGTMPVVSVVKQGARAPGELLAAATGDKAPGPGVRDAMTALGLMTGLPLGQVGKPLGYLADTVTGWQHPESAADVGRGVMTGRQSKQ